MATTKLNKTWLDWILRNEKMYFTLGADQIEKVNETDELVVSDIYLCSGRNGAIRHTPDAQVFVTTIQDLEESGFHKPIAPSGLVKGTSPEQWIEKWYRGSSAFYSGPIKKFMQCEPDADVEVIDVDVSKAYLQKSEGEFGLSSIIIPATKVLGRDIHISVWASDVRFGFGKNYLFFHSAISEDVNGVVKALYSNHFFRLLCDIAFEHNVKGARMVGDINPDLIAELLEEFEAYDRKSKAEYQANTNRAMGKSAPVRQATESDLLTKAKKALTEAELVEFAKLMLKIERA